MIACRNNIKRVTPEKAPDGKSATSAKKQASGQLEIETGRLGKPASSLRGVRRGARGGADEVKIEMIRSLIPLGLMHVHELLDDEVKLRWRESDTLVRTNWSVAAATEPTLAR